MALKHRHQLAFLLDYTDYHSFKYGSDTRNAGVISYDFGIKTGQSGRSAGGPRCLQHIPRLERFTPRCFGKVITA